MAPSYDSTTDMSSHPYPQRLSVLVTGGASGIGLAITRHFAAQGHMVAVLDVNSKTGPEVVAQVSKEYPQATLTFKWCDVSSWEGQFAVFDQAYREHGNHIDIVIANAGISDPVVGALDCTPTEFPRKPQLRMQEINLNGVIYSVGLAVHYMLLNEVGGRLPGSRGSIVCTSSTAALYPFPVSPLYSASKAGIMALVRSMAVRLKEQNIQINALAPGVLETNITPDKELFKAMVITPMSTLTKAVAQFVTDSSMTGEVAELNEDTITLRAHVEYADAGAEHNNKMFWKLVKFYFSVYFSTLLSLLHSTSGLLIMGLGVLPDRHLSDVPGTSFLNEKGVSSNLEDAAVDNHAILKHDPTGKIVLVPQPSDDPNDPLNWSRWKKEMFTASIVIGCGCVGAIGPLLSPAMVSTAEEFDVPLQKFTLGYTGALLISLAFGNLLCNSMAMMIGKRPVYLITAAGLLVTTIWSAVTKDFVSLSISRAIQGFCMSPMEALVPASIADIWFVHQRGFRNAVFNLGVLGGINLASPIAGTIIDMYGYRTCLWAMSGAFGVQLLFTFFFMPESAYNRAIDSGIPVNSTIEGLSAVDDKKESVSEVENAASVHGNAPIPKLHSFIYELRPWSGYYNSSGFWYSIFAPFKMLGSPVVIWGCFQLTICMSWLVLIAVTLSQIFSVAPYNFSVAQVGLTSLSSFVGTSIATALAGIMVDGLAKFMAQKNRGIYEPEFRLPILALLTTLGATGFFGWGQSLHSADPWPVPVIVCLGLINLGIQFGVVGVVSYVVDSHRREAVEAYAIMSFIKNVFAFGMSFYVNDWVATQGVRNCFFVIGGITAAVSIATIPMYIFGKKARSFAFRHGSLL
ncbi:hypothetical protein F53441_8599 [Fusarium austroafricanum]|uniref:Major facilitator superfamily (MFS) profile domain-containing protein n=1 Tax=Fusarium austroafricanum TaxID=2364996 RepID=A0A8H4KB24_9HYPO|nr:hypothetical protein F53441_8599 [Fusarium austroafricanum]